MGRIEYVDDTTFIKPELMEATFLTFPVRRRKDLAGNKVVFKAKLFIETCDWPPEEGQYIEVMFTSLGKIYGNDVLLVLETAEIDNWTFCKIAREDIKEPLEWNMLLSKVELD